MFARRRLRPRGCVQGTLASGAFLGRVQAASVPVLARNWQAFSLGQQPEALRLCKYRSQKAGKSVYSRSPWDLLTPEKSKNESTASPHAGLPRQKS
jgi:hypothetical protein